MNELKKGDGARPISLFLLCCTNSVQRSHIEVLDDASTILDEDVLARLRALACDDEGGLQTGSSSCPNRER